MSFTISGLAIEEFQPLFGLSDQALQERGIIREKALTKPGYPCRITLNDAEPGETVLLLNYESHKAESPYRSSYAIYVREAATKSQSYTDELPPVLMGRPIALRIFNASGILIGADLSLGEGLSEKIETALKLESAEYLHAHNAMHGCFAAEIRRT